MPKLLGLAGRGYACPWTPPSYFGEGGGGGGEGGGDRWCSASATFSD